MVAPRLDATVLSDELKVEITAGGFIAIVDSRQFLNECFRRGIQSAFGLRTLGFSAVFELEQRPETTLLKLVILSQTNNGKQTIVDALRSLRRLSPAVPIVFLFEHNDFDLVRTALSNGAKGCVPMAMRFDIAVEALRFVLAGGAYVPLEYLIAQDRPAVPRLKSDADAASVLDREVAVFRAVQGGKSNKEIAQELNIGERAVRFHLRNIVKKIKDRSRVVSHSTRYL